ncbi:hypothetical protein WJX72_001316 [[Myrmecia] bisecta]|uniref:Ubiquitin-like domain-containing protein n=1 Tax=[Myrmecia] bisecta TaxID=41462 RepID=A0AAW1Q1H3_9CHLO
MAQRAQRTVLTVKVVNHGDLQLAVQPKEQIRTVVLEICARQQWPSTMRVRLICGGRELAEYELVESLSSSVLHCIATAEPPCALKPSRADRSTVDRAPQDWMDTVDPSTVLMWIFGAILVTVGLFCAVSADSYNRTSLTMLASMTVVYIIVFFPWLRSLSMLGLAPPRPMPTAAQLAAAHQHARNHYHGQFGHEFDYGAGYGYSAYDTYSTSVHHAAIPRRPPAPGARTLLIRHKMGNTPALVAPSPSLIAYVNSVKSDGVYARLVEVVKVFSALFISVTGLGIIGPLVGGCLGFTAAVHQNPDTGFMGRLFVQWYNINRGRVHWANKNELLRATWEEVSEPLMNARHDDIIPFFAWYLRETPRNGKPEGTLVLRGSHGEPLHECGSWVFSIKTVKPRVSQLRTMFNNLGRGAEDATDGFAMGNPVALDFSKKFIKLYTPAYMEWQAQVQAGIEAGLPAVPYARCERGVATPEQVFEFTANMLRLIWLFDDLRQHALERMRPGNRFEIFPNYDKTSAQATGGSGSRLLRTARGQRAAAQAAVSSSMEMRLLAAADRNMESLENGREKEAAIPSQVYTVKPLVDADTCPMAQLAKVLELPHTTSSFLFRPDRTRDEWVPKFMDPLDHCRWAGQSKRTRQFTERINTYWQRVFPSSRKFGYYLLKRGSIQDELARTGDMDAISQRVNTAVKGACLKPWLAPQRRL